VSFYTQYLEAFEREFAKSGGKIVAKETFGLKDRDMTPQLTKGARAQPRSLLVLGYVEPRIRLPPGHGTWHEECRATASTSGSEEQFLRVATSEQMERRVDLRPPS